MIEAPLSRVMDDRLWREWRDGSRAGALGVGVRAEEIEAGLGQDIDAITVDASSTDSGPACLVTGRSGYSRAAIKRDIGLLIQARERARVPLLIVSCGTSGSCPMDRTRDLVWPIPPPPCSAAERTPFRVRIRTDGPRLRPEGKLGHRF
jgi:hypothetical protein